jgi:NAD dependent epimerase/dehydratase family enzyme
LSWIAVDDVVGVILHTLDAGSLSGAVNVTVPDPPTNEEYTKTLGHVLGRPTVFPLPAPVARLALGQVADELLLASQRVEPTRLRESGYSYRYPELEGALRHLLGR